MYIVIGHTSLQGHLLLRLGMRMIYNMHTQVVKCTGMLQEVAYWFVLFICFTDRRLLAYEPSVFFLFMRAYHIFSEKKCLISILHKVVKCPNI